MPSVSFGIARIATCRGCPEAFEGWTGCRPSVSGCHIEAIQPLCWAKRERPEAFQACVGPIYSFRRAFSGSPEAFQACMGPIYSFRRAFSGSQRWCASAISVALVNAIGGQKKAPRSVAGLHGSHLQFQACFLRLPKMVCQCHQCCLGQFEMGDCQCDRCCFGRFANAKFHTCGGPRRRPASAKARQGRRIYNADYAIDLCS